MKKGTKMVLILAAVLLLGVLALTVLHPVFFPEEIGTVRGPEAQELVIGDAVYKRSDSDPYSGADRGRFLGIVRVGEDSIYRIYTVEGAAQEEWLYCRWDWEGWFYHREA